MSELRFCNVRFNLDKPEHRRAWKHLQNMDRKKHKSYSNVIISAINGYFEEGAKEASEEKLIKRIVQALNGGMNSSAAEKTEEQEAENNISWGFVGE